MRNGTDPAAPGSAAGADGPALGAASPVGAARPAALMTAGVLALQPLATDLYLPTLPTLATAFGVPVSAVQLTLSLFILAFGLWQLVAGPLSDARGRYPVIMGGILTYAAGSLVALGAPGIEVLIAGRVLQAVGACSAVVAVRASVRDALEPADGARLLARAGSWMGLAPLTGPLIGALLLAAFGWQASFAVLSAASLLLALAAARRLHETNLNRRPDALRPAALWASYRAVLRSPMWHAYAWVGAASYAGLFAWLSGSSFVMIQVLGLSPPAYGLLFSAVVAGFMTGSLVCGRCVARIGMQRTVYLAVTLQAASGGLMVVLALAGVRHPAALAVPQYLFLVGHGLSQPVSQAGAVASFPRQAGAASAMQGVCMMLVAAATGQWIGHSYDGTVVPLAATVAAAGCAGALVAATLVRRHGAPPHVTHPLAGVAARG